MLRALQAVVLGHAVEELRMLKDEVVDALDVAHLQLVLDDDGVQLNELQPGQPCRVPAHGIREQRVEDLEAVSSTQEEAHKKREEWHERVEERSGRKKGAGAGSSVRAYLCCAKCIICEPVMRRHELELGTLPVMPFFTLGWILGMRTSLGRLG